MLIVGASENHWRFGDEALGSAAVDVLWFGCHRTKADTHGLLALG
jgi:hypothetical protein